MGIWLRLFLIVTSALLIMLTFEPFGLRFLGLVAWIPLLIALQGLSFRPAFRLGLLHGMLTFGTTLSWLWGIFGSLAPALWLMLALFTALFAGLSTCLHSRWKPLQLAFLWSGIEYFRGEHFWLSFPWITPGTALPPGLFTSIVGVYGVSFFIILGTAYLLEKRRQIIGIAILLLPVIPLSEKSHDSSQELTIGLMQSEDLNYDEFRRKSQPLASQVDLIVWPEYAIGFDPTFFKNTQSQITELLSQRARFLVTGGQTWHDQENEIWSNTAYTFDAQKIVGRHFKNHTVHLFNDGEKGTTALPIETAFGKIGTPVCFDCDHQDVVRRMTADGAEFFLIPSMDAAHWTERQHLQHGTLFRHRAAENGRWLAVASTSGLTQFIKPSGKTAGTLPLMKEGHLIGTIAPMSHRTLFQRGGWLIGPITLGVSILLIVSFFPPIRNRIKS